MKIWVDADACPGAIKELIIRTARRLKIPAVFVANKVIGIPDSAYVAAIRVGMGLEVVDEFLAQYAAASVIVVTQVIRRASALVAKGVTGITPRGELYTEDNIRERLSIRNFMQDIREAGAITPGPRQFGPREKQQFSDTFDRELTKCMKQKGSPR